MYFNLSNYILAKKSQLDNEEESTRNLIDVGESDSKLFFFTPFS